MSIQKPQTLERAGATSTLPKRNLYEASEELDAGIYRPDQDSNYSNVGEQFDVTPEYWKTVREHSLEMYKPSETKVEDSNKFPLSGEFIFRKVAVQEETRIEIPQVFYDAFGEKPANKEPSKKDDKGETLGDYLKDRVNFGLFFKFAKETFKFGLQTVKELRRTAVKAATEKPDGRTPEQRAEEAEKKHKKQVIEGNINRAENEAARVKTTERTELAQESARMGTAGMDQEMMSNVAGKNVVDLNRYTINVVSEAMRTHQKRQEKMVMQQSMAEANRPVVNMNGAPEGGTAGGKVNTSTTGGGGAG